MKAALIGVVGLAVAALAGCSSSPPAPLPDPYGGTAISSASPVPSPTADELYGGGLAGGSISDADWQAVVDRTLASVLLVENDACGYTATGSAFVVSPHLAVTNRHVVEDAVRLGLRTSDGDRITVSSWETSTTDDLAVLHTGAALPASLPIRADDPVPGDLVVAVGYPLSGPQKATRGRVLGQERMSEGSTEADIVRTTAEILPGNSGGPLLDTTGEVVGVNFALDTINNDTLALPVSRLARVVEGRSLEEGRPCRS